LIRETSLAPVDLEASSKISLKEQRGTRARSKNDPRHQMDDRALDRRIILLNCRTSYSPSPSSVLPEGSELSRNYILEHTVLEGA